MILGNRLLNNKRYVFIISLLPALYLFILWLLFFNDTSFNNFLFAYFDDITDFSEYIVPLKYITGWLHGDVVWEYAKLALLNPIRLINIFPSLPISILLLLGFNAYLANLIIATISLYITNYCLLEIYDRILTRNSLIKLILIILFTFFSFNTFFRSYINQSCFVLSMAGIYLFFKYFEGFEGKYLKWLSILVFISFFSYTFAMLFLLSLYFCVGLYLFLKKYSIKKWLTYSIFPLLGIVLFLIINFLFSKLYSEYFKITSFINRVESVWPSIDLKRFLLLVFLLIFSLAPFIFKRLFNKTYLTNNHFYLLTISLFLAHFHTIIDRNAIQEDWHFNEVINILYFVAVIIFIKHLLQYKNHITELTVYLILSSFISFLVISNINLNTLLSLNNFEGIKEKITYTTEIKKIKNTHYDNIIVDNNLAAVWQNNKLSNPLFINGSAYFFLVSFEEKIDLQILSFLASINALDSTTYKSLFAWYNAPFMSHYLNCSYNYHRFGLCSFFKNSELCTFYQKHVSNISRDSLLQLFSNNDKLYDFFRKVNNPIINKYDKTYQSALKTPLYLIKKYNLKYAIIHKSIYPWWKEKTNASICDSIKGHYIIKF